MSAAVGRPRVARGARPAAALASALLGCMLLGCGESRPDPELESEPTITVVELGSIGGRIFNEPERAEEILKEVGLAPEEFEARIRVVTNDPMLSGEYTRGFEVVARPAAPVQGTQPSDSGVAVPEP